MIVSNASPLIYLAKVGKLELLKIFGEVVIPEEVKVEVVDKGKELEKADAYVVERAIEEGWIKVLKTELIDIPIKLHPGERAVLSLAKTLGVKEVLVDEKPARFVAKLLGLKPRGTIFVLLKALEGGLIDFDEFLDTLDELIRHGFRIKEDVIIEAIRKAKELQNYPHPEQ
jgi:predicted nucleic acid-binding protein